jgi:hypothetical protein
MKMSRQSVHSRSMAWHVLHLSMSLTISLPQSEQFRLVFRQGLHLLFTPLKDLPQLSHVRFWLAAHEPQTRPCPWNSLSQCLHVRQPARQREHLKLVPRNL